MIKGDKEAGDYGGGKEGREGRVRETRGRNETNKLEKKKWDESCNL